MERKQYFHGLRIDKSLAVEQKGKIVQKYEYDSFGNLRHQGNKVKQPYTFTSREWDREIGLCYYRARYMTPESGRFISFDPILRGFSHTESATCSQTINSFPLQRPQKLHPYVYVENNPVNFVDPSGFITTCPNGYRKKTDWLCFIGCILNPQMLPDVALVACCIGKGWRKILPLRIRVTCCVLAGIMGTETILKCYDKCTTCVKKEKCS